MNLRLKRNRRDFLNGRELRASRLPAYPSNQTELPNFPTVSKVVDNFLTSGLFIVNSTDPHFNFMRGVRYKVMCAQMSAHRAARFQLVELPLLKEQARRFMDALDSSTPILASIVDADAQKLSFELSDFMKSGPDLPLAHLSALQDAARLFQTTCARFYKQFPYNIRPNTNRDELSWHFIDQMARVYEEITGGQKAAKSKAGPFVRLLAAAWVDLQWPAPLDRNGEERDDIEGWLGERVEKHPSITQRKSPPKKT